MLANVNLAKDLTLLAPYGRVAVIGSRGSIEINPRDAMARNAEILGVMLFGAPAEVLADIHRQIVAGLEAGTLQPVVGRELPLADAAEAHRSVMSSGACGKIVLLP
jgi:NADPH2:quinone reductase